MVGILHCIERLITFCLHFVKCTLYVHPGIPQFAKVIYSMKTVHKVKIHESKMKFPLLYCKSHQTYKHKLFIVAKMKHVEWKIGTY
jgi:hypothetical protein